MGLDIKLRELYRSGGLGSEERWLVGEFECVRVWVCVCACAWLLVLCHSASLPPHSASLPSHSHPTVKAHIRMCAAHASASMNVHKSMHVLVYVRMHTNICMCMHLREHVCALVNA